MRLPYGGFSLVELVVVVAILGLVAAAAAPWLVRIGRRTRLRSAAAEIQSSLLAARMRAVKRNQPASVFIVPAGTGSTHEIDTIEAEPPAPTPTPNPVNRVLVAASTVRFVSLPPGQKITFDGNGRRIGPPPPTPGEIVVEGPVGGGSVNQITIRTSLTGRVEVVTPAVWQ
jgi:prepilin-type N-terminal cleavage/methylation domain-containing protein